MTSSRRLPAFDATRFETLSHEEKLKLLNEFLEALHPQSSDEGDSPKAAARTPRRARRSTLT